MSNKSNSVHAGIQSKDAARESEERYRLIVESALDYAIFTTDLHGTITTWPPGAAAVFGWSAEEVVGRSGDLLFTPEDVANREHVKEIALAKETGVAPDIRWHIRKDGSHVFIEGWTRALRNSAGEITGLLKIGQDTTQRRKLETALRESEERFRTLVVSIPQMVFRSRGSGERTWGSPQWEVYTSLSLAASLGTGWLDAIHPDDKAETIQAWQSAEATGQYYVEHRIRRAADAQYRWHQTRAVRLPGSERREWVGTSTDVHDLRQLHDQQSLLIAELQHRTRNLLAVVQSIMQQTLAKSRTLEEFGQKFQDRLAALSRVQGLLSNVEQEAITLAAVLRLELDALGAQATDRISLDGPNVVLPSNAIQTLALAIHELATNARKYGALRHEKGRLQVRWRLSPGDRDDRRLVLEWVESGVETKPHIPPKSGFGRTLIEVALAESLGAKTGFQLTNDGVYCTIELAL
jgi:PAS domain S-box-containing protein